MKKLSEQFYGALNIQRSEMKKSEDRLVITFTTMQSKLEEMQKALEWYADTENYRLRNADEYDAGGFAEYHVMGDNGERARQALKGDPK